MKQFAALVPWICLAVGTLSFAASGGQEETRPSDNEEARLRSTQRHVRSLRLQSPDSEAEMGLIGRPLLTFADPVRLHQGGTVWAWGDGGRPAAIMEVWTNGGPDWRHAVMATSPERVELILPDGRRWQAPDDAFEQKKIAEAEAPQEKPAARLRQLKDLAKRFRVHEIWKPDNSRIELRLLIQPVYRYADPAREIQDGAIFIFAHGTNPETILLIEATGKSPGEARWNYSVVRSTSAELHVELDEREVWSCLRADGTNQGPRKTYWGFNVPIEATPAGGN
jgi:hypothetical protein